MKTITLSYTLNTNGKKLGVSLQALFRAVGLDGEVTAAEIPMMITKMMMEKKMRTNFSPSMPSCLILIIRKTLLHFIIKSFFMPTITI